MLPISVFVGLSLSAAALTSSIHARVVISEIMSDPSGSEFTDEFIEIHNIGEAEVDLSGWLVGDETAMDALVPLAGATPSPLAPGAFALILDPDYDPLAGRYGPLPPAALLLTVQGHTLGHSGLSNREPETVTLAMADGKVADAVAYEVQGTAGFSWERRMGVEGQADFAASRWEGGTPGRTNSWDRKPRDVSVALVNPVAAARAVGEPDSIVLLVTNVGTRALTSGAEVAVAWDSGARSRRTGNLAAGDSEAVRFEGPGGLGQSRTFRATVTLAGDEDTTNDTVVWTVRYGVPAGAIRISELMIAPSRGGEWIEIWNGSGNAVDLADWRLRDRSGVQGQLPGEPRRWVLDPGGYAVIAQDSDLMPLVVPSTAALVRAAPWPSLNNNGDEIALIDAAGAVVDVVAYTGAGVESGVSMERVRLDAPTDRPPHWLASTASAGSTPGQRNSVAFEPVPDLRMTVTPNPFESEARIDVYIPESVARISLAVFDGQGRPVRDLLIGSATGSHRAVVWTGEAGDGVPVVPGLYILLLEATLPDGRTLRTRSTAALARGF